ncbi:Helix-turn-helix [Lutibacter agarilyticus]|uniref:Helix-turn-helix n=1 Tax=Lutibacter agarilyticus TaxID=1109740 RepID=A0A238VIW2_9FLAO|nr:helix-turn-helix transcriptional regulator [Lutibacter agarilyticus]SNR34128.1 Helix-turn-helix [Lutibacter agarilyticus]
MVNSEAFTKRLKIIIEYYDISAAVLAEKMDVQRSSISHILSGRNKPSLDFVMKILKAFPEVELYWLLNGDGKFPKNKTGSNVHLTSSPIVESKTQTTPTSIPKVEIEKKIEHLNESDIERIVIFYKDGSFKHYLP